MLSPIHVRILRLPGTDDLPLPAYKSEHAAAMDVSAAVVESQVVPPGGRALIPCGFAIALPDGYEAQIRPRSGLAASLGLTVVNSPGTIDADYRGEVKVAVINHGPEPVTVDRGMRIAQLLVTPVPRVLWDVVDELPRSARGGGGFGHTGVS
jgi:dUTP pyrophosphatase